MPSTLMGRLLTPPRRRWPSRERKGVWSPSSRCWSRSPVPVSRMRWLDNDPAAIEAAWSAAVAEGEISEDLGAWELRCLIYVATGDVDFHDQAQQAANEIPNAEFISFEESDHVGAHLAEVDPVLAAVLRTLRASG